MREDDTVTEELKPCPFCGTDGDYLEICEQEGFHYVACLGCALEAPFHASRAEAAAAWNRRTAPSGATGG